MEILAARLASLKSITTPAQQTGFHITQLLHSITQLNAKITAKIKKPEDIDIFVEKYINGRTPKILKDIEGLSVACEKSRECLEKAREVEEKRKARAEKSAKAEIKKILGPKEPKEPKHSAKIPPITVHIHMPSEIKQATTVTRAVGGGRKKTTIPKSIKEKIWHKYVGRNRTEAPCLVCRDEKISIMNFHAGHVVAEANGGETTVENLRPICSRCNLQMGSMNMNDYCMRWYKRLLE